MGFLVIPDRSKRFFWPEKAVGTGKSLDDVLILQDLIQIKRIDPFGIKACQHLVNNDQEVDLLCRGCFNALIGLFFQYSIEVFKMPYMCRIKENEESCFKNNEKVLKEINKQKNMNLECFVTPATDTKRNDNHFVEIGLSLEDCLKFYNCKFKKMNKKIEGLIKLRNKRYAHKDPQAIFEKETFFKNSPSGKEIKELIDYSIDLLNFFFKALRHPHSQDIQYICNNDLEDSLKLIRFALESEKTINKNSVI